MTITLTLDTELANRLTRLASIKGVSVEQFALDTLRRAVGLPTSDELSAEVGTTFEASEASEIADEELK